MAPPELARDAPVMDVAHPLEISFGVLRGRELDVALLDSGDGLVGQRLNLHKPLCRQARLYNGFAAVALAHRIGVLADGSEQPLRL